MTFAKRTLAALAVVAMFGLMTSSASAVTTSLSVNGGTGSTFSGTTSGSSGGIGYTVNSIASSAPGSDSLLTNTVSINNNTGGTASITLLVTGSGFNFGGTTVPPTGTANYSISGTGGPPYNTNGATDNASFTGTVGSTTLTPTSNGTISGSSTTGTNAYVFTPTTSTPQIVNLGSAAYSIGESITVTLGAGDKAQFTETIGVAPNAVPPPGTPEPSTLALAGLGTLGFVAYGLRRRKARTT